MSSEIVYYFQAIRLPPGEGDYGQDFYLLLLLGGSSNCFESGGGNARRSRSWQLYAAGQDYRVMARVCELAGDCCGGMLKYKSATAYCEPETIIRAARKAIKEAAAGFEGLSGKTIRSGRYSTFRAFLVNLRIKISEGAANKSSDDGGSEDQFDNLSLARDPEVEEATKYMPKFYVWRFDWKNAEDVALWKKNLTSSLSQCMEVSGAGD